MTKRSCRRLLFGWSGGSRSAGSGLIVTNDCRLGRSSVNTPIHPRSGTWVGDVGRRLSLFTFVMRRTTSTLCCLVNLFDGVHVWGNLRRRRMLGARLLPNPLRNW
uniref:Uncharacterized protein n=1 Tax=Opuntia streptacantha TaxID=393608 RepID=A0A7C8ZFL2_OPUST